MCDAADNLIRKKIMTKRGEALLLELQSIQLTILIAIMENRSTANTANIPDIVRVAQSLVRETGKYVEDLKIQTP